MSMCHVLALHKEPGMCSLCSQCVHVCMHRMCLGHNKRVRKGTCHCGKTHLLCLFQRSFQVFLCDEGVLFWVLEAWEGGKGKTTTHLHRQPHVFAPTPYCTHTQLRCRCPKCRLQFVHATVNAVRELHHGAE